MNRVTTIVIAWLTLNSLQPAHAGDPSYCPGAHHDELGWVCSVVTNLDPSGFGQGNFFRGNEIDEVLPKFGDMMRDLGVDGECSGTSGQALKRWLQTELRRIDAALASGLDDDTADDLEDWRDTYLDALEQFDGVDPVHTVAQTEACRRAKFTVYAMIAEAALDTDAAPSKNLLGLLRAGWRAIPLIGRTSVNTIPYRDPNAHASSFEAKNLVDPSHAQRYMTRAQLGRMKVSDVALLDVSSGHPWVHTRAAMANEPDPTARAIAWTNAQMAAALGQPYDLPAATAVLIFDEFKSSATSPKLDARGVAPRSANGKRLEEFKLKLGEEAGVEPITGDLWRKWGGKAGDLVFHQVGGFSQRLVLATREDQEDDPDECVPTTRQEFVDCFKSSHYDFQSSHHILESHVIGPRNYQRVLGRYLPPWTDDKYREDENRDGVPDAFEGRTVLVLKESSVESKLKLGNRVGPAPMHNSEAVIDRALRGSFVFALWVRASDDKEDNNRIVCADGDCLGAFHDIGSALSGSIGGTGEINSLSVGGNFLYLDDSTGHLRSNTWMLYRPQAWDHITMADFIWGAGPIAAMSQADIRDSVAKSHFPDFWQDVAVWRLAVRRDRIAHFAGLPVPDPVTKVDARGRVRTVGYKVPQESIPLTTPADRQRAARRFANFGITARMIARKMRANGLLGTAYEDVLVADGEVSSCSQSVLVNLLEEHAFPARLTNRVNRRHDGASFEPCELDVR